MFDQPNSQKWADQYSIYFMDSQPTWIWLVIHIVVATAELPYCVYVHCLVFVNVWQVSGHAINPAWVNSVIPLINKFDLLKHQYTEETL